MPAQAYDYPEKSATILQNAIMFHSSQVNYFCTPVLNLSSLKEQSSLTENIWCNYVTMRETSARGLVWSLMGTK